MFGTQDLWAFYVACVILWVTPGTDTMYILVRSISQGNRAGIVSVLGISTGSLIHTFLAAVGLSAVLLTSAWLFLVIKYLGAAYLIYIGIQAILRRNQRLDLPKTQSLSYGQIYRQGVVTNVLNPKIALFFLAFLPQFVMPEAEQAMIGLLFLGATFVFGGTLWCLLLVRFASLASISIRSNERVRSNLQRAAGLVYIGLGLNLLRAKLVGD